MDIKELFVMATGMMVGVSLLASFPVAGRMVYRLARLTEFLSEEGKQRKGDVFGWWAHLFEAELLDETGKARRLAFLGDLKLLLQLALFGVISFGGFTYLQ